MKSEEAAVEAWVAMMCPSSVVFGHTAFAVDLVLLPGKHEQHDHEGDERALCSHVEAERKVQDGNDDLVQRHYEQMDNVAKKEPEPDVDPHQPGRLLPMKFVVGWC